MGKVIGLLIFLTALLISVIAATIVTVIGSGKISASKDGREKALIKENLRLRETINDMADIYKAGKDGKELLSCQG